MGASKETLLSIDYVTDHDCGNYQIGEIDFSIRGSVKQYFLDFGLEGKKDIINKLAFLIYYVEQEYRSIDDLEK